MIDAIYYPEPLSNKPDWFNGFIELEKHFKEKYNWRKFVYLPNYYSDLISNKQIDIQTKYGQIKPTSNSIDSFFVDYYRSTQGRMFGSGTTVEIGGDAVGNVSVFNCATGHIEHHRYLYANDDYIVRQLDDLDKPRLAKLLKMVSKEISLYCQPKIYNKLVDNGLVISPINKKGELHGTQTFSFMKDKIACEPLTYINSEARGQGIFSIYHEMALCLGKAVESEYIYSQCVIANKKMTQIYESYGYIRQKKTKMIRKGGLQEMYMFHYPLENSQMALF